MVIVLTGALIEFPRTAPKLREPVVGRPATRHGLTPEIPIALWVITRSTTFDKPRVPIRGVVRNKIEQDPQPASVGCCDQGVEIRQRSEDWIDVGVVGDIVTEISHRR